MIYILKTVEDSNVSSLKHAYDPSSTHDIEALVFMDERENMYRIIFYLHIDDSGKSTFTSDWTLMKNGTTVSRQNINTDKYIPNLTETERKKFTKTKCQIEFSESNVFQIFEDQIDII